MKEQAIQKINKVGKISAIVALVSKILVILGLVVCAISLVVCLVLPKDLVKVTTVGNMVTEVNYEALGIDMLGISIADEMQDWSDMQTMLENGDKIQIETKRNGMMSGNLTLSSTTETYIPTNVNVENGKVTVDMETPEVVITLRQICGLVLVATIATVMTLITIIFIEKLCKAFRDCQSPFEENVIKKMQNVAYALIPWTLISGISESIMTSFMSNSLSFSVSLDMGVVLVVLIVLVLVYIFKYGAVLQQESDETL